MNYNEIYLRLFIAIACLVALYFVAGRDEPDNKDT